MNKKKLLGLGIVALAFGAVAGAMSAQKAVEADADSAAVTLYCKVDKSWWKADGAAVGAYWWHGSVNNGWPGARMTPVEGDEDVWKIDVPTDSDGLIFVRVNGSGDIADWGAKTANLTLPTDGKNLYTITSDSAVWGDPGVTGEWSVYEAPVDPGEKLADGYYLVGSMNEWKADENYADEKDPESGNYAEFKNVALAKDDEFKIAYSTSEVLSDWHGYYDLENGEGGADMTGKITVTEEGDNFLVEKDGTYSIYLFEKDGQKKISIYDEGYVPPVPDVPETDGYYLVGNEVFTGNADTAFKYAGGVKLSAPEEGDDLAVLLNQHIVAGSAVKVRSHIEEADVWHSFGEMFLSFAGLDEEANLLFTKTGDYNFFVNKEGLVYVTGEPAGPIAEDGYLWVSTGDYGLERDTSVYVYSWTEADPEKGIKFTENAEWPGKKAADITGASITNCLNFNGKGGIWQIPAKDNLFDNVIISIREVVDEAEVELVKTGDLKTTVNAYIDPTLGNEAVNDLNTAKQAVVAKMIADAVDGAENDSVCAVNSATADTIVKAYDALGVETDLVDNATLYTYEGALDPEKMANVKLNLIVEQLRVIAETQNVAANRVNGMSKSNKALIITLAIAGAASVLGGAMFVLNRKRKHQN